MVDSYTSNFNVNSVALQRSCFTEKHALTESFAALMYVRLLGRFVTVQEIKPDTQTQPTAVTLRRIMYSISY